MVLLESCLQTSMTYTIAECTVNKLLMMDRRTVRNIISRQNKFVKLVHLVGFITKKYKTMFHVPQNEGAQKSPLRSIVPLRSLLT